MICSGGDVEEDELQKVNNKGYNRIVSDAQNQTPSDTMRRAGVQSGVT